MDMQSTIVGAALGKLGLNAGRIFYVDGANGGDGNSGKSPDRAVKTLAQGYSLLRDGKNDVLVVLGSATAVAGGSGLTWAKSYTHLVGATANMSCGQRARITGGTTLDPTYVITVSGNGCYFANLQIYNGTDADADSGALHITGDRFYGENLMISGMGHVTPGARAGCYSLKLTGSEESTFKNCYIGLDTVLRAQANGEVVLVADGDGNRPNRITFEDCMFVSNSVTAGKFLIKVTNLDRWLLIKNCVFYNYRENHGTAITNAINDAETATTHDIILHGDNPLIGCSGYADVVTYIYGDGPAPNNGYGVAINPVG